MITKFGNSLNLSPNSSPNLSPNSSPNTLGNIPRCHWQFNSNIKCVISIHIFAADLILGGWCSQSLSCTNTNTNTNIYQNLISGGWCLQSRSCTGSLTRAFYLSNVTVGDKLCSENSLKYNQVLSGLSYHCPPSTRIGEF